MKAKLNHLRFLVIWPILAIIGNEIAAGMNYDDHTVATLLYFTSAVWGFPVFLAHWLFERMGIAASDWIIYFSALAMFVVITEVLIQALKKPRATPNKTDELE